MFLKEFLLILKGVLTNIDVLKCITNYKSDLVSLKIRNYSNMVILVIQLS